MYSNSCCGLADMSIQSAEKIYTHNPIQTLSNGTVLVDYGPMRMFISVFEKGKPLVTLAKEGAHLAMRVLEDLAKFLPLIKRKSKELEIEDTFPEIVRRMIEATKKMEEPDLTPLAAVAGTASDMVADFIFGRGGTKIIVDNGGDIAIRLREGEVARVGVKMEIDAKQPTYLISIDPTMGIGGVATSGLGGRSFTKGIASAATALSQTAAFSDAAATVIGNFTNVENPNIVRSLAEKIYPDTDIAGEWVTIKVGKLSQEKIEEALNKGLLKAYSICQKGLIKGALVALQGNVVWTDSLDSLLTKL
ncbi:MAG: hypothetical protein COS40_12810 [Deltaproteobacteria bacterium CG03_land_8_20_14_0_80_45_14]|nr:MAG: hypothetical protein COS40_12810 [Deltaproteobacteria bacterium CG03_land_8_20_14_0_80_45_14]